MRPELALLGAALLACSSTDAAPTSSGPIVPAPVTAPVAPAPVPEPSAPPPLDLANAKMLAMTGGRLLFWTEQWARVRDEAGKFGMPVQLPDTTQWVAVNGERALAVGYASGATASHWDFEARMFDARGSELARWRIKQRVRGLALDATGPRVLTEEGAVLLQADGKTSTPIPYTPDTALPLRGDAWPFFFSVGDVSLYCLDNTPTKEYAFASYCARVSDRGVLYAVYERIVQPLVCGPWLVHVAGPEQAHELHVRAATTGAVRARIASKIPRAIVCDDGALYALTEAGIERRALPTLKARGKLARPQHDHILDMALLPEGLVYRLRSAPNELHTMPPAP